MNRSLEERTVLPTPVPTFLLVGPYDPSCGEYTFLAPPLAVWRLAGVLRSAGHRATVFDPNCCEGTPESALTEIVEAEAWTVVGFSMTGMTLRHDLALAHLVYRLAPEALQVAGGMEATFNPDAIFRLGPIELVVLGEGENPLLEVASRLQAGASLTGIEGTAFLGPDRKLRRLPQIALSRQQLRDAIYATPYDEMPYRTYWRRLETSYRIRELPYKADREARLAEIRSVRLVTLNYCPMGCTFCSSTNFLNAAQGSTARIARLETEECVTMMDRILTAQPEVRTIIFQDDIFVFPADRRILPLCQAIQNAKADGHLPQYLGFISTNRIDAMTPERLSAMRCAGFRVLGFGIENFSLAVLTEFKKAQIYHRIVTVLGSALNLGITPFLDLILTSPRCCLGDLAETIRQAHYWTRAGCETGMYPYVIPFSGAALAADLSLRPHTVYSRHHISGTNITWNQPAKILPLDLEVREAILTIEARFWGCLWKPAGGRWALSHPRRA